MLTSLEMQIGDAGWRKTWGSESVWGEISRQIWEQAAAQTLSPVRDRVIVVINDIILVRCTNFRRYPIVHRLTEDYASYFPADLRPTR